MTEKKGFWQRMAENAEKREIDNREVDAGGLAYHQGVKLTGEESNLFQKGWYKEQKTELRDIQKKKRIKRDMENEKLEYQAEQERQKRKPKDSGGWNI